VVPQIAVNARSKRKETFATTTHREPNQLDTVLRPEPNQLDTVLRPEPSQLDTVLRPEKTVYGGIQLRVRCTQSSRGDTHAQLSQFCDERHESFYSHIS
jgi:hypothetical protein